jgi:methionine aminotransferase
MKLFASKLPDVGTTIFTVMSQLAAEHAAINLSQGFPDFSAPPDLLDRVSRHLSAGHNQYAPMAGAPELREQIARKIERLYGYRADHANGITVTSGATEAIFCAVQAFLHPGEEVIVFDPAYDSYEPAARLAGADTIHVPLAPPAFSIDWQRVRDALSARTRMIIVNSPHNPTGAVLSAADLEALAEITRGRPIVILSDEVYEHIIFDGLRHESLLRHAELAARSLVVSSFGKTYHATGWKIGYCVSPPALMAEFRKVHQFVQFCVVTPMQLALAEFLESAPEHYLGLSAFYQAKRDFFCELLLPSRFRLVPSRGTYFQLLDYGAITRQADVQYARWLTCERGVASIPVSVFYRDPPQAQWLRFCFAKDADTLRAATDILCRI